ncbi:putative AAA+ ATPase domain, ATPase, AAA-type, core, AAA-type ATPase domain-containing protein [Helianthus annuus]|uniref:AAA+ ATPase domain, ATPase, AAA-type, core, AAA-type ATPase domain-containing protein n=1 Tax=Helianthus annuus TaxID=4232 RepID=A0A251S3I6_HELAN|nr:AAA-ATPase At5g17760 [Helianthus annuus]KAF5762354.1 putative AAA+ ATPase domain, ATPase, AAA-type, core, AAA-type ATPase domain-containing protein [Helianthus annuus]KAJ0440089.1 putative AAA+ ATPase domain, ATPase, AAA-type, core, AAA-type ATPase domain-containing protein [Helianthus annuus]KAJ0445377.1 putative AAA+ ATPase domain, ATPase, AAA-type, core, AAA-type ATPase domain-containing protein [Helianthus annuus]KAJ0462467.1 putative AAA+ ATPase domain, ATPase, AAA-type, core, AAA-type 
MAARTFPDMPTPSSLLSAYASMSTSIMLFRTMFDQLFPRELRRYIIDTFRFYWKPKSSKLTLVFEEKDGITSNQMYDAVEAFLCSRINPESERLRITKSAKENHINVKFADSETITDSYEGVPVTWTYVRQQQQNRRGGGGGGDGSDFDYHGHNVWAAERKYIELKFEKKYKEMIISCYLPWILQRSKELQNQKKVVKLYNLQSSAYGGGPGGYIESVNLDHPSTFETLAMDPKMKKAIVDDLDLFVKRKELYKRVGKVWKRGYLLYGPPGTGKSSLIAAIANYMKFDVYDLQLSCVGSDSSLKNLLLRTSNRSILVIEDIDCSLQLPDRKAPIVSKFSEVMSKFPEVKTTRDPMFSLSGLLNFIDGLWSSCGDERIIIFTTNHKERLDSALLRPGRMDVHIHMSYLTVDGFDTLAANYLNIHDGQDWRFREIKELIKCKNVTPAEVAEELLKSDDVDVVLEGLVKFLKRKKIEEEESKDGVDDDDEENEVREAKKVKIIS